MVPFEILEHTADVGLRIFGKSQEELFRNAAQGLYYLTLTEYPHDPVEQHTFQVVQRQTGDLLVGFFKELIFWLFTRHRAAIRLHFDFSNQDLMIVQADFVSVPSEQFKREIKSPTYHHYQWQPNPEGWMAEIYFDI